MRKSDYTADSPESRAKLLILGQLLKRKRMEKNFSVYELAKIVGITPSDISALEAGEWEVDVVLLMEIANVLKSSLFDEPI